MSRDLCIISPHDISREGLLYILRSDGFNIVGSFQTVSDMANENLSGDFMAVIDLPDPAVQLEALAQIKSNYPSARVVVLVEKFDMHAMAQCFDMGARGYIIKSMKSQSLIAALRLVSLGEKVLPSELADALSHDKISAHSPEEVENEIEDANLSPRERDVLCCLMAGYSNKVIARELDVCEATVKVHVKAILRKLDVRNRTQAAIWASTRGVTESNLPARIQRMAGNAS